MDRLQLLPRKTRPPGALPLAPLSQASETTRQITLKERILFARWDNYALKEMKYAALIFEPRNPGHTYKEYLRISGQKNTSRKDINCLAHLRKLYKSRNRWNNTLPPLSKPPTPPSD